VLATDCEKGSIQTLFRIFDTYGHQLGPSGWTPCLKIVVFKMMNINPKDLAMESESESDRKNWDETIKLILSGIGTLYSNYFEVFAQQRDFGHTWTVFIRYLEDLLSRKSFEVSTAVFHVVSRVLARVGHPENLASESRQEIWRLWSSQGVKLVEGIQNSGNGVQETLGAYVQSYQALYRLLEPTLTADTVRKTLEILRDCMLFPDAPPYFQDIDMVTPLQASILEVIRLTRTDIDGVPSLLIKQLSEFSTVAFSQSRVEISGKGSRVPSCIALSTQSIAQLETIAIKHIRDPEIYVSSALAAALAALEVPIGLKYDFAPASVPKGKCPNLWIYPTRAALAIVKATMPALDTLDVPDDLKRDIWKAIVTVVGSVLKADNNLHVDEATLRKDEILDIEAFRELRSLIIPSLGRSVVPDETVLNYIEAVFWSSMLHRLPGVPTESEEWLIARKQGSTSELVVGRRHKMGYVCIDELLDLTAVKAEDGPELRRIAEMAAPWLIRRVGLVLGRYVSDQPLRGRMPQPASQRKEMLYVLDRVIRLDSGLDTVHIDCKFFSFYAAP
jgi:hypothetical protein